MDKKGNLGGPEKCLLGLFVGILTLWSCIIAKIVFWGGVK